MTTTALKSAATGTAVARTADTFPALLEKMKPQLLAALPKHLSADRMMRVALTCFRNTPALHDCDVKSILSAIVQAAQLGLEPGLLGQAYLIPFKRNWKDESGRWQSRMECQFIPGYRGLIALARRSGEVLSIDAEIVYENDEFDMQLGSTPTLVHRPNLLGERGRPKLVYGVARFRDGSFQFQWMTMAQVEAVRSRSKASNNGPWVTDYDEMVRKTVVRRLCKYLPLSVELAQAVAVDDAVDIGRHTEMAEGGVIVEVAEDVPPPREALPAGPSEPEPSPAQRAQVRATNMAPAPAAPGSTAELYEKLMANIGAAENHDEIMVCDRAIEKEVNASNLSADHIKALDNALKARANELGLN